MPKSRRIVDLPEPLQWKISEQDGHWLWCGRRVGGYGQVYWRGRIEYAHRLVYRLLVRSIPRGRHVHHLCNERACVNPEHLQVLTNQAHGRVTNGGKTHCKHGHEFTPENIYWAKSPSGLYRHCRACQRRRNHEFAARHNV